MIDGMKKGIKKPKKLMAMHNPQCDDFRMGCSFSIHSDLTLNNLPLLGWLRICVLSTNMAQ